jgi:hypothetical protein
VTTGCVAGSLKIGLVSVCMTRLASPSEKYESDAKPRKGNKICEGILLRFGAVLRDETGFPRSERLLGNGRREVRHGHGLEECHRIDLLRVLGIKK